MNCTGPSRLPASSVLICKKEAPGKHADELAEIKKQLDECVEAHPFGYVSVTSREKIGPGIKYTLEDKTPLEQIVALAGNEYDVRSRQQKGLNAHLHEPVYAAQALEDALKKSDPKRFPLPHSILEAASHAYSNRFFSLLLKYGVKPDIQDIRDKLQQGWKNYLEGAGIYLSYLTKYQHYQQSPTPETAAEHGVSPGLEPIWSREGSLAAAEGALSNLKLMDLSVRAYAKAHAFIEKLRNRIAENRQQRLLAELEAEAAEPKKLSKSAKRKARQKAHREQKAPIQPSSSKESPVSNVGVNYTHQNPFLTRSVSSSGEIAPVGPVSPSSPDDAAIRALREKLQHLLPTQTDRDEFRSRVQSLKKRMERIEDRLEEIRRFWEKS